LEWENLDSRMMFLADKKVIVGFAAVVMLERESFDERGISMRREERRTSPHGHAGDKQSMVLLCVLFM